MAVKVAGADDSERYLGRKLSITEFHEIEFQKSIGPSVVSILQVQGLPVLQESAAQLPNEAVRVLCYTLCPVFLRHLGVVCRNGAQAAQHQKENDQVDRGRTETH